MSQRMKNVGENERENGVMKNEVMKKNTTAVKRMKSEESIV